jgi:hypothetical protein
MDIQTRKLNLIESLISLQDEALFDKIEKLLKNFGKNSAQDNLKPITKDELIARAAKSNYDIGSNNVTGQELLEKESESW